MTYTAHWPGMYVMPAVSRRRPPRSPNSFGQTSFAATFRSKLCTPTSRRPCTPDCHWLIANGPGTYQDSTASNHCPSLYWAQEIAFAEVDAVLPQHSICGRHVKKEIRQREI